MKKKKLLLLGGSAQQVVAIEKAKELGYYTILCDYLPDNPGQYYADKFYQYSTTDKELMLKVATEEKIDGIVAYASDPAAPSAAYVAEKLGLPELRIRLFSFCLPTNGCRASPICKFTALYLLSGRYIPAICRQ